MEKRKISINDLRFENFEEKHVEKALKLALCELEKQRNKTPALPCDVEDRLKGMLHWVSGMKYGKVAIFNDEMVGYIAFAGPWDGFFGDVAGVFSPLGANAFSYEIENRERVATILFEKVAKDFVKDEVFSCSICRFADDGVSEALILNGFGIRCADFIGEVCQIKPESSDISAVYRKLSMNEHILVKPLQKKLHQHLSSSPIFYYNDNDFEEWFEEWSHREDMCIYGAFYEEKLIGFISVCENGENYITSHDNMKNICGAFVLEEYRSMNVSQQLLSFILSEIEKEGIVYLGVDCETLNPTALNFWSKYFTPYTYSFARRIDERINR